MLEPTSRQIPRAQPYAAPDDLLAAREQMRYWSRIALGAGFFLILTLSGLTVYLVKQVLKQEAALAALESGKAGAQQDQTPPAGEPKKPEESKPGEPPAPPPPLVEEGPATVATPAPPPLPAEGKAKPAGPGTPPPPPPPLPAEPGKPSAPPLPISDRDKYLDALGKMTGVNLYQSYLNIGLMADSVEKKLYTKTQVAPWLARVTAQLELMQQTLNDLPLSEEEMSDVAPCQRVAALLLTQTTELRAYWETGDRVRAEKYHKAREAAWAGLRELLDLTD